MPPGWEDPQEIEENLTVGMTRKEQTQNKNLEMPGFVKIGNRRKMMA